LMNTLPLSQFAVLSVKPSELSPTGSTVAFAFFSDGTVAAVDPSVLARSFSDAVAAYIANQQSLLTPLKNTRYAILVSNSGATTDSTITTTDVFFCPSQASVLSCVSAAANSAPSSASSSNVLVPWIIVGLLCLIITVVMLVFFCRRRCSKKPKNTLAEGVNSPTSTGITVEMPELPTHTLAITKSSSETGRQLE